MPITSYLETKGQLKSASARLRFILKHRHMVDLNGGRREARVQCIASIPEIQYRVSHEVVLRSRQRHTAAGMGGRTSMVSKLLGLGKIVRDKFFFTPITVRTNLILQEVLFIIFSIDLFNC